LEEAEVKGMGEEVKAALRAFTTAPVDMLSQAAGTIAPTLLAAVGSKVLGAGLLAARAVGAGVGAGMGAGVVKGTIYDETKKALLDTGMNEEQAEARASLAQSYGGENLDMILGGAALGGLAATTGVEKALIAPLSRRILGTAATKEGAEQAVAGLGRRVAGTAAAEALPEFVQGAQEQLAANLALQREGMDRDLFAGVTGAGTLEALAGAGLGAGVGALTGRARPEEAAPPETTPEEPKLLGYSPDSGEPMYAFPDGSVAIGEEAVFARQYAAQQVEPPPPEPPKLLGYSPTAGQEPMYVFADGSVAVGEEAALARRYAPQKLTPEELSAIAPDLEAVETQPVPQEPLPAPEEITRTEADIQQEVERIRSLETIKPTPSTSLYEFFAYRPKRDEESKRDNRLDTNELIDIAADRTKTGRLTPAKQIRFLNKQGGKRISDFLLGGNLNPWLPFEMRIEGTEDADVLAEKEPAAEEYIKDLLRNQEYVTYETKIQLERSGETLSNLERMLEEYNTDEERRTEINSLLSEITPQLEQELPSGEFVEAPPAGTERGVGEPAPAVRPEGPLVAREPSLERPQIKIRQDNPGGEWLKNKQEDSIDAGLNQFNVPRRFGATTGTLNRTVLVPVDKLARVKGMRGEQMAENIRPESLEYLTKQMSETGRLPPSSVEGEDYAPFLNVYQDGTPYVNEGNHRIMVAKKLGWKYVPIQISWFNGAEQSGGEFSPEALLADDARAYQEGYSLENYSEPMRAAEPSPEDRRRADAERDFFQLTPGEARFAPTTGVQGDMFGATGQLAPTTQLQRRKNNNTEQLSLFVDSDPDPSQPDSQEARVNAVEAVEQLQETNNPLAMNLADELANRQVTMLVGKRATTPEDMAILAQVYRDQRFETFRMFFTDKDGNIVSQLGITSRMPASTAVLIGESESAYVDSVMNVAKDKGATGYFLVHNHPSGKVAASASDRVLSRQYAQRFKQLQYKGHIIIDTNKYGVIEANGTAREIEKDFGEKAMPGQMGEFGRVDTVDDAAVLAKQLEVSENDVALLVLNSMGNVMQLSTIPSATALRGDKPRLRRMMQKTVLKAKGANLIVVSRDRNALLPFLGMVKDTIHIDADGKVLGSATRGRSILGGERPARMAAATSPEFNYLKSPNLRTAPQIAPSMFTRATEDVINNPNVYPMRRNIYGQSVNAAWGRQEESKLDTFIHVMQDKMVDVKRVQEQIRKHGKDITDRWNPYLKEELFHGRAAKKTKDFLTFELDPLMKEMEKRGVGMAEFEDYLHNRTAKERNELVAKRDPDNFPDGGSGILTADAQAYLAGLSPKKKADYEALAKIVDKITKGTRDLLVKEGHESKDTIDTWEKSLPNYVPLNRAEADYELSNMGTGVGQGYGVRGAFSRAAVGSERPVVNILANIAMQRERAIVRTEKMRVAQALYGLVLQNPNPGFWLAVDPEAQANPEDLESIAKTMISMGFSPDSTEVSSILDLAKTLMQQPTMRALDPSSNAVIRRANLALVNSPFALPVRINGSDKYVFFNPNDPIAARMAKSLRNVDADQMDKVLGPIAKITRYFAAINTQYNPIFGVINFLRDAQGALIQLTSTPLNGKQKQVMSGTMPALRGIYADLRARREGKKAKGEWTALWNKFQDLGGQTGFRDQFSRSEERADALYAVMNPSSWTETKLGKVFTVDGRLKVPLEAARRSVAKPIFDWLTDYNETMENAIRLSAFKTALDSGMTEDQAASVAKNLTVNFNRKGLIGKQAGALYAFFNASVQGTARMAQTLFQTKDGKVSMSKFGKRIFYGGLLLGSAQAMLLAAAGFDEEEPPEFIKERNIVIPVGGGKYVTIPMPLGYNVIPNTSRVMTEWAMSGFKDTSKRVAQITGALLEMFNPIGNAGWSWQTFSPTLTDPAVALFENRDWTGKPIAKEDFSNLDPTPGYTRARETASWFSKNLSEFLNLASGGTEFKKGLFSPTPDQIDYLIGQLTGGVGREVLKAEQTVTSAVTGEELPTYKIPLIGRFVGDTTGQAAVGNKFYGNLIELNSHQREIEGRRKAGQEVQSYIRDNPESRLYKMADRIQRNVSQLRKRRADMLERGATKEQVQAIENQITVQMQRLNEAVDRLKE